jgi:hypothetical protein
MCLQKSGSKFGIAPESRAIPKLNDGHVFCGRSPKHFRPERQLVFSLIEKNFATHTANNAKILSKKRESGKKE